MYDEPSDANDEDTAGLLYVGLLPADAFCFPADCCEPEVTDVLCLATVLLADDVLPEVLVAVALLLDDELPLMVPRPVLLLVPMPLLTVVFLPLSVNTRVSPCVSWRGPYQVLLPICPPLPIPGP